jgi:AraC-like DNA-binding protein
MTRAQRDTVACWRGEAIVLERYDCATRARRASERHSHEEYQLGLSSTEHASYRYRGARHQVAPGTLSVIHTGEAHETYEHQAIAEPVVYDISYVAPSLLQRIASELAGRHVPPPYFPSVVIADERGVALFKRVFAALRHGMKLDVDATLEAACSDLVLRFSEIPPNHRAFTPSRPAIRRVADYLRECYAENRSLKELADMAGLGVSHFCAVFHSEYGLPPHQFRLQVRIERAKQLLFAGLSIADVALQTGFSQQSHFGRHFKRLVGVSPGSCAQLNGRAGKT